MRYPMWKYVVIALVLVLSTYYALPNLWPDEPAVQISGATAGAEVTEPALKQAMGALQAAGIPLASAEIEGGNALIKFANPEIQLQAQETLKRALGENYVVALNFAQSTPDWLRFGAKPMKLGLDLRGGVHFLLEVDLSKMLDQRLETSINDFKRELRSARVPLLTTTPATSGVNLVFRDADARDKAQRVLSNVTQNFSVNRFLSEEGPALELKYTDTAISEISRYAVEQNLTTLRNRINELGVSEAIVQSQGTNRILVELPGVQDTAEAKRVLGKTANLEFRLVSEQAQTYTGGPAPIGTETFPFKTVDGAPVLLERSTIVTGERVQNAQSGRDQNGGAKVDITLDTAGGRAMQQATTGNVGRQMAVLFIETKERINYIDDPQTGKTEEVRTSYTEKTVINQATLQAVLGSQFQITGLDSPAEASELALLLRAGALAAPMSFVEERTIGPSLGQENIERGVNSVIWGFLIVALFMLVYYKVFGIFANVALFMNLAMMFAIMSIIGGVLSLPGIAGIVLTIGMAVDANVLIYERIREELAEGASPKHAIVAGYDRAFGTIFDANLTTFIVAFLLYAVGTGPVKGFAITLSIGILCSMFTAVVVTRALSQLVYGRRDVTKLWI